MTRSQRDDLVAPAVEKCVVLNDKRSDPLLHDGCERSVDVLLALDVQDDDLDAFRATGGRQLIESGFAISAHAHQREVQKPRLRRDESLHRLGHSAWIEVVDDVEHGRVVHKTLVGGAV